MKYKYWVRWQGVTDQGEKFDGATIMARVYAIDSALQIESVTRFIMSNNRMKSVMLNNWILLKSDDN